MAAKKLSSYEAGQNYSFINRFLHARRYNVLENAIGRLGNEEANKNRKLKILDIGCGEAKVFELLSGAMDIEYTGIDYKSRHMEVAMERYGKHDNFKYINDLIQNHYQQTENFDVVICLETFEHIREFDVSRIIENIAKTRPKLFLCSVPNEIGPIIWIKNLGSFLIGWKRHREYSWFETLKAGLYMQDRIPRHTTEHKGFDWRWLAQTIKVNMNIRKIHRNPVNILPLSLSPSIIFECTPDE